MSEHESSFSSLTPIEPVGESFEVEVSPSRWPGRIGTISIVFASLGLLCYGCNSLSTISTPFLTGMVPEDQRPPVATGGQLALQLVQLCGAFLLSAWLLAAGIGLCKRRPWAPRSCVAWSWVKILFAVIGSGLSLVYLGETVQQVNDQLGQQGTAPFQFTEAMFLIAIAVSLIIVMIWPAFLLIWFARRSVKEDVARWGDPSYGLHSDLWGLTMEPQMSSEPAAAATARSGWPMPLGVIAIVFGALGALAGCLNIGMSLFAEQVMDFMDEMGQPSQATGFAGMVEWKGAIMFSATIGAVIALSLAWGGVLLTRRRPASRAVLLTWAIVKIVFVVAGSVLGFLVTRSQFEAMQSDPATAGVQAQIGKVLGNVFAVLAVLWGWALPGFILVWFGRGAIRGEMATWSDADDALPR